MPEESVKPACYLCGEQRPVQKLFKKCKHPSACYDCLRTRYVKEAKSIVDYPLCCFHPDCRIPLQSRQVEELCESESEIQIYHLFSKRTNRKKWLEYEQWKDLPSFYPRSGKFNGKLCRCPRCGIIIMKAGGCDHMTCFCGHNFSWEEAIELLENKMSLCEKMIQKLEKKRSLQPTPPKRNGNLPQLKYGTINDISYCNSLMLASDMSVVREGRSQERLQNHEQHEGTALPTPPTHHSDLDDDEDDDAVIVRNCADQILATSGNVAGDFEIVSVRSMPGLEVELEAESDSNWEELSEISSVISFNSELPPSMSFLEAAKSTSSEWQKGVVSEPAQPLAHFKKQGKGRPARKHPETIFEEEDEIAFLQLEEREMKLDPIHDQTFHYEGTKCARGGKSKYRFGHQPKLKYSRSAQCKKSNCRLKERSQTAPSMKTSQYRI